MDNGLLLAESDYNKGHGEVVLILIVMDNGLLRDQIGLRRGGGEVLILIVMDNGLLPPNGEVVTLDPNKS